MTELTPSPSPAAIPAASWPVRQVGLKVLDLPASLDYYQRLGFTVLSDASEAGVVQLGAGGRTILRLRVLPGGHPRPQRTAGLYHFALLLPDEATLGAFLRHCIQQRIPLGGASDHLVSQALYLSDPEGNGIEVYADRPRDQWAWQDHSVRMATLPLNLDRLLKLAGDFDGFPPETRLGHMHLNVGDLQRSTAFYQRFRLTLTAELAGQAHFLSWDGYHHHLGLNVWAGRGAAPVEPDVSGIDFFEIAHPGLPAGTHHDPDGITVRITQPA